MAEVKRRNVGGNWTWFEDYVFLWAKWTASCPQNRQVQVGMGVSVGGEPRGEKIRFSGLKEFTTIGPGSIHFRVTDGGPPCEVILYSGKKKGVPIIGLPLGGVTPQVAGVDESDIRPPVGPLPGQAHWDELEKLQARGDGLYQELREVRSRRRSLRASLVRIEDLGADCDGNRCHTEKKDEVISAGEIDSFVHDDQDRGSVNVHCKSGEIEVIISAAVWSKFDEVDRKLLRAGQTWNREIPSQSGWADQTNRVEIVGKSDSVYNLDFTSWDD